MRRGQRAANVRKMKRAIHNIEVQVDKLILHGPFASNRYDIGDAFSHQLGLLLKEADLDSPSIRGMYIPLLHGSQIAISSGAKPAVIGTQLAQAVHDGLNTMNRGGRS